jgi:hypothetical protein
LSNENIKPITPFVTFGNNELEAFEPIGETCKCPACGLEHTVTNAERVMEDGTKIPTNSVQFIKCTEHNKTFMVGICGKKIDWERKAGGN